MAKQSKKPDFGTLYFLYVKKNYSQKAIAENFKVSKTTVYNWLKEYEITRNTKPLLKVILDWIEKKLKYVYSKLRFKKEKRDAKRNRK